MGSASSKAPATTAGETALVPGALETHREELQEFRKKLGDKHEKTLTAIINLGDLLKNAPEVYDGAERAYREAMS